MHYFLILRKSDGSEGLAIQAYVSTSEADFWGRMLLENEMVEGYEVVSEDELFVAQGAQN